MKARPPNLYTRFESNFCKWPDGLHTYVMYAHILPLFIYVYLFKSLQFHSCFSFQTYATEVIIIDFVFQMWRQDRWAWGAAPRVPVLIPLSQNMTLWWTLHAGRTHGWHTLKPTLTLTPIALPELGQSLTLSNSLIRRLISRVTEWQRVKTRMGKPRYIRIKKVNFAILDPNSVCTDWFSMHTFHANFPVFTFSV